MRAAVRTTGVAATAVLAACSLFQPTPVETGTVKLVIEKSSPVYISLATMYQEKGRTVINGEARFPTWVEFGIFRGHIDLQIEMPNSLTIERHDIRVMRRRIPNRRGRRAHFVDSIERVLPEDTIIRISYHEGTHGAVRQGNLFEGAY